MPPEPMQVVHNLWRYSLTFIDREGVEHTVQSWSIGEPELRADLDTAVATLIRYGAEDPAAGY